MPEGGNLAEHLSVDNSPVLFGCRTGICGTCLVTVVATHAGELAPPDRDEREVLEMIARDCAGALYFDGIAFTQTQADASLRACNRATSDQLGAAGITGAQASIITSGRTWSSLGAVAGTTNIGPITMEKLRALGAGF